MDSMYIIPGEDSESRRNSGGEGLRKRDIERIGEIKRDRGREGFEENKHVM